MTCGLPPGAGRRQTAPTPSGDDLRGIDELQRINFGVHEEHMRYKAPCSLKDRTWRRITATPGDGYPNAPQVVKRAGDGLIRSITLAR